MEHQSGKPESIRPFRIEVPDAVLDDIRRRVREYPWHEMPDDGGWSYGTNLDYMKELCAYWLDGFDWRQQEARLNRYPQFTARVDGVDIHFIHERSDNPDAMPLLISHGWPGSVVEFLDIIEPLSHPERHGGNAADAFPRHCALAAGICVLRATAPAPGVPEGWRGRLPD